MESIQAVTSVPALVIVVNAPSMVSSVVSAVTDLAILIVSAPPARVNEKPARGCGVGERPPVRVDGQRRSVLSDRDRIIRPQGGNDQFIPISRRDRNVRGQRRHIAADAESR